VTLAEAQDRFKVAYEKPLHRDAQSRLSYPAALRCSSQNVSPHRGRATFSAGDNPFHCTKLTRYADRF
jgi:hypothetical protein